MEILWQGLEQVTNRLTGIERRIANPTPALQYGQRLISRSLAHNFLQEGRPERWARRVSDPFGRFKHPDKKTHPVLRLTGRLCNSTVSTNDGGDSISRITIADNAAILDQGTRVPYAIYHQAPVPGVPASFRPRTKLARRMFLVFQPEDVSEQIARVRVFLWWGE